MCKWSTGTRCTALGDQPWPDECPLPPLPWFDDALDAFVLADDAIRRGDLEVATRHLAETRDLELREWMHIHAQNSGAWRAGMFNPPVRPYRASRQSLAPFTASIWRRDNFRCCYCGIRVIVPAALRAFSTLAGPKLFPIKGGNLDRHGIKMVFSATLDHVAPVACGGTTTPENLVTACWCCNYGKAEFTIEELGIRPPSSKPDLGWRGLSYRA